MGAGCSEPICSKMLISSWLRLSLLAMSLAVTNAYALQSCFNLPRDSAAYFACESLNQQERFINEQRERQKKHDQDQEQEDLNRRYQKIVREAEEYDRRRR